MRAWLAAACVIVFVGSLLAGVADAGRGEGGHGGKGGGGKGGGGGRKGGGGGHGYSGAGGGTAVISPDEVKEMQKVLTDRGLYEDAVDGIMGPRTTAALKAFQAAEGLAQTGYLDRDSRVKLGLQVPGTK